MTAINFENLPDFIRGTAFLGTGGGGDPYIGQLMLMQELEKCSTIELINPDDVAGDVFAVSVACMGAPTVFVEKIPNVDAAITGIRRLEKEREKKIQCDHPTRGRGCQCHSATGCGRTPGSSCYRW